MAQETDPRRMSARGRNNPQRMNAQKLEAVRDDWNLMRRVRIIAKRHGSRELYYQCCNEAESLRGRMQYLETKSRQPNDGR
jgi:hypothetical protein